jgi:lambda repressor-like predicted transcriptional regulator
MHAEEIKAAMRMKGITPTALADELGVANSSVSQVISGRSTSARIANRIAQIIGKPVHAIWPAKKESTLRRVKTSRMEVPA